MREPTCPYNPMWNGRECPVSNRDDRVLCPNIDDPSSEVPILPTGAETLGEQGFVTKREIQSSESWAGGTHEKVLATTAVVKVCARVADEYRDVIERFKG